MNIRLLTIGLVFGVASLLATEKLLASTEVTLLDETFASGSYNPANHSVDWIRNGQDWHWSAPTGSSSPNDTETYGANAMSARGMGSLGANGGFEVNSDPNPNGTWMVDTKVTIPANFNSLQPVNIGFDYGFRGLVSSGTVPVSSFSLFDLSTGATLFTKTLAPPTSGPLTGVWQSADYSFLATGLSAGHIVDLQWKTTSSSSSVSLEVGGPVTMSIAVAPGAPAPPMTACLAFAGVLLLQALRRHKAV